jgi:hypothetical protein
MIPLTRWPWGQCTYLETLNIRQNVEIVFLLDRLLHYFGAVSMVVFCEVDYYSTGSQRTGPSRPPISVNGLPSAVVNAL